MSIKYLNIIKSIEIAEIKSKKKNNRNEKYISNALFLSLGIVVVSLILLVINLRLECDWVKLISLLLLALSQLVIIFAPCIEIYKNRKKIKKTFQMPFNYAININVKKETIIDEKFLPKLISLDKKELELGLMEIKHERNFLEKRILIITGPIEKLGMLPSIISTLVALYKITEPYNWVSALAYGYIGLIIISLMFHQMLMRYDRMISLTKLALEKKS